MVETKKAGKEFLNKQRAVLDLLWRPDQPELKPELHATGLSYKIEANLDCYSNQDAVKEFLVLNQRGMLPRGEIFSIFHSDHLHEAIALFKVLYHSKDFDTFCKTAAWARIYVNEGMYVYAFSVAVIHYPETFRIRLPSHHELYPHLFFKNEVIRTAYDAKLYDDPTKTVASSDGAIIIPDNDSIPSSECCSHDEYKLRYFTEDVYSNEIHYFSQLSHPFWMKSGEFGPHFPKRGEVYLWALRLQLARYNMERFSNGLGEIEDFDWSYPIPHGYHPSVSYHNGLPVPHRSDDAMLPNHKLGLIKELRNLEQLFASAIDSGFVFHKNATFESIRTRGGIEVLGNLIQGNADSVNHDLYGNYELLARDVLGFSPAPRGKYDVVPSIMQVYGLSLRDPMYWSLVKRIMSYHKKFVSYLPKYTYKDLAFPDVKIESVAVDKVETYFDDVDYLISAAVKARNVDDKTLIKARQYRLNHKPYTYHITVNSKTAIQGYLSIYMGPKYDFNHEDIDLTKYYDQFILLDAWAVDLQPGINKIERSSAESEYVGCDPVSSDVFYREIERAITGETVYEIPKYPYRYPERLVIPKGSPEGVPFQFFVHVTPYAEKSMYHFHSALFGEKKILDKPLGFPLDRPSDFNIADLPNAYLKEFKVYHKEGSEINESI
ncbi:arylphorin subunit alpha-like [Neodiprion fabricii]|uniref:arylphorin subunit alpha-like n=1 Tax=Neodiprion fabricii TaxID=2872261 RepID=UPI001ED8F5D4|nr:arylphorin subunit alpha-like [Neodiprion fabricii]